jgi:hypothetical protein
MEREGKRRRVLQPGELERQHGGGWNGLSNGYQGVGYGNNRTQAENGDGYNNTGYGGQGNRLDGNYSGMNHQYNSGIIVFKAIKAETIHSLKEDSRIKAMSL